MKYRLSWMSLCGERDFAYASESNLLECIARIRSIEGNVEIRVTEL
jgi:hypothetical protein